MRRAWHWLQLHWRWLVIGAGCVGGVAVLLWVWWEVPRMLTALSAAGVTDAAKVAELENNARATISQTLVGIAALVGIYFALRNTQAAARNAEAAARNAEAALKNAVVASDRLLTERFAKAIELLGSDQIVVRLGAIYALERLVKDSPKDHWTIMEVLTAYVRERAPAQPDLPWKPEQKPATDIQAAMTVIGRRIRRDDEQLLDLRETDLRGAFLRGAQLDHAILEGAHLEHANLIDADLQVAWLVGAHLEGASLREAKLGVAHLRSAHLEEANLTVADLKWADLTGAHLEGADLLSAHLETRWLDGAHLEKARLVAAHLEGADLRRVEGLTQEQINEIASWDETTKLPPGLRLPERPEPQEAGA